jgi:hypothetical protein
MGVPLSTAVAAGLISSVTSQRQAAARARRVARDPDATEADLREALQAAAHRLDAHAYLTEGAAELCGVRPDGD